GNAISGGDELRCTGAVAVRVVPKLARRAVVDDAVVGVMGRGASEKARVAGAEPTGCPERRHHARVEPDRVDIGCEIGDVVCIRAAECSENVLVSRLTAEKDIITGPAIQRVRAVEALQVICARTAGDGITELGAVHVLHAGYSRATAGGTS